MFQLECKECSSPGVVSLQVLWARQVVHQHNKGEVVDFIPATLNLNYKPREI